MQVLRMRDGFKGTLGGVRGLWDGKKEGRVDVKVVIGQLHEACKQFVSSLRFQLKVPKRNNTI